MNYILDTNIITAHMRNNETVRRNLVNISLYEKEVYISAISYYEIKRGLLAKDAIRKLDIFEKICKEIRILFLDNQNVFDKASEIYADLKQKGELIEDADVMIAATALTQNLVLVSNDSDFLRVKGVIVDNWLRMG